MHQGYGAIFTLIAVFALAITLFYYRVVVGHYGISEKAAWFGDMFGGLSGLSFAGVIVAIWLQMEELKETRKEMERSSKALHESQIALNEQLLQMQIGSKFQMVSNLRESPKVASDKNLFRIVNKISLKISSQLLLDPEYLDIITPKLSINTVVAHATANVMRVQIDTTSAGGEIHIVPYCEAAKAFSGNYGFARDLITKESLSYGGSVLLKFINIQDGISEMTFVLNIYLEFLEKAWSQKLILTFDGENSTANLGVLESLEFKKE